MKAPVRIGDVVIENVLGLGSDVVITKNVEKERA
jgi:CxxC motif-containing protein